MLALAIVFAIVVYARPRYLGGRGSFAEQAEQKLADTISSGLDKLGLADPSTTGAPTLAEAPEPATMPSASGGGPKGARVSGPASQKTNAAVDAAPSLILKGQLPPVGSLGGDVGFGARDHAPSSSVAVIPPPITSAPGHLEDGLVTYTAADTDVAPPRLSRQQLPRQPEPGDDTGYFDVTVNESGDVDHVQLISPMRRFQERMLMAAAKAWKFKPALRDGQPVRYRIRIPIIIADKP